MKVYILFYLRNSLSFRIFVYFYAEKQHYSAVEVAPGEYLYAGKYKIVFQDGRFRCALCSCNREEIYQLYSHFGFAHPDQCDEISEKPPQNVSALENSGEIARVLEANDEGETVAPPISVEKVRLREMERIRLKRAIAKGWKMQENGRWWYKNWEVMEQAEGKYKCLACDHAEGDRATIFSHVRNAHGKIFTNFAVNLNL